MFLQYYICLTIKDNIYYVFDAFFSQPVTHENKT